jgi:hypothetical protein
LFDQVVDLWEEHKPDVRELLYLTGGALGILVRSWWWNCSPACVSPTSRDWPPAWP